MAKSKQSIVLTRREALLLSTTAGLGAALGKPAFGSDSVKTGAHQGTPSLLVSRLWIRAGAQVYERRLLVQLDCFECQ